MNRSIQLTIAVLASAVLLAGCGGGSSSSTATSSSTAAGSPSSPATTSTAKPGSSIGSAIAQCKQIIQSQNKLPATAKRKLEGACAEAAKGNTGAVKAAAREVCEEVIGKANLPNGAAKEAAEQACKK
jgi:hypothetical protein